MKLPQKRSHEDTLSSLDSYGDKKPRTNINQPNSVVEKMRCLPPDFQQKILLDFDIEARELVFNQASNVLSKRFMKFHQIDPTW